ncbi:MAG: LLM class flavin-dependent oxidoreductase, partial [Ilumatobacteraceae bacterium]
MKIGMCFPRELEASVVRTFAERLEAGGADELWVIEDCFYTAGISLAATALARTERLTVGIGIMPAVARNPAITAMEVATLANLAPGRVIAGIGHGVQEWMSQMGVRPASPVTTLEETITVVRRLLAGEEVTFDGRAVHFDAVKLAAPPSPVPPVIAGVRGPKSLAVAGRCADGIVLAEFSGPAAVCNAVAAAGSPDGFEVAVFTVAHVDRDRRLAREWVAPFLASMVT